MSYSIAGNDSFSVVNDLADNLPFLNVSKLKVDNLSVDGAFDLPNLSIIGNSSSRLISTAAATNFYFPPQGNDALQLASGNYLVSLNIQLAANSTATGSVSFGALNVRLVADGNATVPSSVVPVAAVLSGSYNALSLPAGDSSCLSLSGVINVPADNVNYYYTDINFNIDSPNNAGNLLSASVNAQYVRLG